MGVHHLWTVLDSIKASKSLLMLSVEHRVMARSAGTGERGSTFTVGVDMGTFMAECNAGALNFGVNYQRAGSGLYLFFRRLGEFLRMPAAFVFVLDGPARPPLKRGHEVQHRPIWWTHLAIELVEYFGFEIHHAPGEAEAELAKLNEDGHIHAVITSDSDAFLFGVQKLLRSIPKDNRRYPDEYSLYSTSGTELPFTREGAIFFALLCGGDYADGIDGCGPTTAAALARCGFGDQLLAAYRHLRGIEYEHFLVQWRCAIRTELRTNTQKFLSRCQPQLAATIPDNFPDHRVLDYYANPITSWSPGRIPPDSSRWRFKQPSVAAITQFCIRHFHWRDLETMKLRLKENLWEGVFLQILYSPCSVYNHEQKRFSLPNSIYADVLEISYQPRRGKIAKIFGTEAQPKLVISTASFLGCMGLAIAEANTTTDRVTAWPPAALVPKPLQLCGQKTSKSRKKKHGAKSNLQAPRPETHATEAADNLEDIDDKWVQIGENHWFIDLT
ncbi:PIN domain-like protein [Pholiota molesta]|nr:PIN domain-like protein [Pholiota molesta]